MAARYRYGASKISQKSIATASLDTFSVETLMERRRKSYGAHTIGESSFHTPSSAGKLSRNCLAFQYVNAPGSVFTFFNGEKTDSAQKLFKSVKFCGITYNELLGASPGIPSQAGKKVSVVVYGALSIPAHSPRRLWIGDKLRYCLPQLNKKDLLAQYNIDEVDLHQTELVATVEEVPVDNDRLCLTQASSTESMNRSIFLSILKLTSLFSDDDKDDMFSFLDRGLDSSDVGNRAKLAIKKFLPFFINSEKQEAHWAVQLTYNPLAGNTRPNLTYNLMKEDPFAFIFDHLSLLREESRTHFAHVVKEANDFGGDLDVLVKI